MNVAGVIAEYNPFHKGHQYQLDTLRKMTEADHIVIAMSGNFLERGVPAMFDKFERARAALMCGADLVLEIPCIWATASAEYYAAAGVGLLGATGIVTHLGFGMESEQPELLASLAAYLNAPDSDYQTQVASLQKQGLSYPAARTTALCASLPDYSAADIAQFLASPNNILALEYTKALAHWNHSHTVPIQAQPILRKGDGYHAQTLGENFASATAIRQNLFRDDSASLALSYVPDPCQGLYRTLLQEKAIVTESDLSQMLYYRLRELASNGYCEFADVTPALSDKIRKNLMNYQDCKQFCTLLKSKDITYTRICRALLHILLDIRHSDYVREDSLPYIPYLRVLGFHSNAVDLLREIKHSCRVPLITKMADTPDMLSEEACHFLEKDIFAGDIYAHLRRMPSAYNEISHPIVKMPL